MNDIYARQFHRVISGTSPLRGFAKVGDSLQNLIFIPMNEFHKDGFHKNFLYSLKKEFKEFCHTMTTEVLHAGHQLTMTIAHGIKDLVSEDGSTSPTNRMDAVNQPNGIQESLGMAYNALEKELESTAETIVAVPIQQYERAGTGGYMRSVIRAMPVAILRPAAGVSEALSYTLLGMRNQMNPQAKSDADDEFDASHSVFLSPGNRGAFPTTDGR